MSGRKPKRKIGKERKDRKIKYEISNINWVLEKNFVDFETQKNKWYCSCVKFPLGGFWLWLLEMNSVTLILKISEFSYFLAVIYHYQGILDKAIQVWLSLKEMVPRFFRFYLFFPFYYCLLLWKQELSLCHYIRLPPTSLHIETLLKG